MPVKNKMAHTGKFSEARISGFGLLGLSCESFISKAFLFQIINFNPLKFVI